MVAAPALPIRWRATKPIQDRANLRDDMTRDRLWTLLPILLAVLGATIAPMSTVDLAYQVRVGDLIRASGSVLRSDPLTFTAAGQAWLNQQWGASLLLSLGYSAAGWAGLALLRAVLVSVAVALVFWTSRRWLPVRPAAALALAAFVVGIGALALRAQLFGIVCFVLVVALLADRRRRPRLALLVPLVVLAWVNLHGSFFLGVGAAALALIADLRAPAPSRRNSAAILALSAAASVVTPFGPGAWSYALGLSTNGDVAGLVTEWQRTSPLSPDGGLFYISVLLTAGVLVAARRRDGQWPPIPRLLWLGGLLLVGAWAGRGVVWWAFGAPAVISSVLARLSRPADRTAGVAAVAGVAVARVGPAGAPGAVVAPPASAPPRRARPEPAAFQRLNLAIVLALVALVVLLQPIWRPSTTLAGPDGLLVDAPVGLAIAMRAAGSPTDRAVVPQRWASWFEWAAPGVPVMVDSRIEVMPASAWSDYLVIAAGGPEALESLSRNGVSLVVVERRDQPALLDRLRAIDSGWRILAEDGDGALFRPLTGGRVHPGRGSS